MFYASFLSPLRKLLDYTTGRDAPFFFSFLLPSLEGRFLLPSPPPVVTLSATPPMGGRGATPAFKLSVEEEKGGRGGKRIKSLCSENDYGYDITA